MEKQNVKVCEDLQKEGKYPRIGFLYLRGHEWVRKIDRFSVRVLEWNECYDKMSDWFKEYLY